MRDRIIKFLELEHISAAKFADDIGVQRSSISHILSGRNNPSFDFIQKILSKYRKLNAEWLIMGTGNIYKTVVQGNLFENLENKVEPELKIDVPNQIIDQIINSDEDKSTEKDLESNNINTLLNTNKDKKIEKIILLYADKTFSTYSSE
jgi:transcriptional regulator with XRE-family HTH domain